MCGAVDRAHHRGLVDRPFARDHGHEHRVGVSVRAAVRLVDLDVGMAAGQQIEELGEDLEVLQLPREEERERRDTGRERVPAAREETREALCAAHGAGSGTPGPWTSSKRRPASPDASTLPRGPTT